MQRTGTAALIADVLALSSPPDMRRHAAEERRSRLRRARVLARRAEGAGADAARRLIEACVPGITPDEIDVAILQARLASA